MGEQKLIMFAQTQAADVRSAVCGLPITCTVALK